MFFTPKLNALSLSNPVTNKMGFYYSPNPSKHFKTFLVFPSSIYSESITITLPSYNAAVKPIFNPIIRTFLGN